MSCSLLTNKFVVSQFRN